MLYFLTAIAQMLPTLKQKSVWDIAFEFMWIVLSQVAFENMTGFLEID